MSATARLRAQWAGEICPPFSDAMMNLETGGLEADGQLTERGYDAAIAMFGPLPVPRFLNPRSAI